MKFFGLDLTGQRGRGSSLRACERCAEAYMKYLLWNAAKYSSQNIVTRDCVMILNPSALLSRNRNLTLNSPPGDMIPLF